MKIHLSKFVAAVIILFCAINADAQNTDYFISTTRHDTVKCAFKSVSGTIWLNRNFSYLPTGATEYKKLNPDTVAELSINRAVVARRALKADDTTTNLIQWVHRGRIDMYSMVYTTSNGNSVTWYASKDKGPLMKIKDNNVIFGSPKAEKNNVNTLVSDYPELVQKFKTYDDYSFNAVENAIMNYNDYFGQMNSFIITQKKDTIKCQLIRPMDFRPKSDFKYKITQTGSYLPLSLDTVNEYVFRDTLFIKRKLPKDTAARFLNVVTRGKIDVYVCWDAKHHPVFYASKNNGDLFDIGGKSALLKTSPGKDQLETIKKMIADYPDLAAQLQDYPDLGSQLQDSETNSFVLRSIILKYNKNAKEQSL